MNGDIPTTAVQASHKKRLPQSKDAEASLFQGDPELVYSSGDLFVVDILGV